MIISNQEFKKVPSAPLTAPRQALDAPDYKHGLLSCHINRIDSSHKKIDLAPPPQTTKTQFDARVPQSE